MCPQIWEKSWENPGPTLSQLLSLGHKILSFPLSRLYPTHNFRELMYISNNLQENWNEHIRKEKPDFQVVGVSHAKTPSAILSISWLPKSWTMWSSGSVSPEETPGVPKPYLGEPSQYNTYKMHLLYTTQSINSPLTLYETFNTQIPRNFSVGCYFSHKSNKRNAWTFMKLSLNWCPKHSYSVWILRTRRRNRKLGRSVKYIDEFYWAFKNDS